MENVTVDWYLDRAKERAGLKSDRELNRILGCSSIVVSSWRRKMSWPSDDNMVQVAELAGVDPAQALIDLNTWRTKSGKALEAYQRVKTLLASAAICLALLPYSLSSWTVGSAERVAVYIMLNRKRVLARQ